MGAMSNNRGEYILVHGYLELVISRGGISDCLGSDLLRFNLSAPDSPGCSQAQPTYFPQNVLGWTPNSITGNNNINNNTSNAPRFDLGAAVVTVRGPR